MMATKQWGIDFEDFDFYAKKIESLSDKKTLKNVADMALKKHITILLHRQKVHLKSITEQVELLEVLGKMILLNGVEILVLLMLVLTLKMVDLLPFS